MSYDEPIYEIAEQIEAAMLRRDGLESVLCNTDSDFDEGTPEFDAAQWERYRAWQLASVHVQDLHRRFREAQR